MIVKYLTSGYVQYMCWQWHHSVHNSKHCHVGGILCHSSIIFFQNPVCGIVQQ